MNPGLFIIAVLILRPVPQTPALMEANQFEEMLSNKLLQETFADWLDLNPRQMQIRAAVHNARGRDAYVAACTAVRECLTPAQRAFALRLMAAGPGACIAYPYRDMLAVTPEQVKAIRAEFSRIPQMPVHAHAANPNIRSRENWIQNEHDMVRGCIEVEQYQYNANVTRLYIVKRHLTAQQYARLIEYVAPPARGESVNARMRELIRSIRVDDEIRMSLHQVRVLQDESREHRDGDDNDASQWRAVWNLTPAQRTRLKELALQRDIALILDPKISLALGLTYYQRRDLEHAIELFNLNRQLQDSHLPPPAPKIPRMKTKAERDAWMKNSQAFFQK